MLTGTTRVPRVTVASATQQITEALAKMRQSCTKPQTSKYIENLERRMGADRVVLAMHLAALIINYHERGSTTLHALPDVLRDLIDVLDGDVPDYKAAIIDEQTVQGLADAPEVRALVDDSPKVLADTYDALGLHGEKIRRAQRAVKHRLAAVA